MDGNGGCCFIWTRDIFRRLAMNLTLVTGNKGKLMEWQRLVPVSIQLEAIDVDLDEIQSLRLEEILLDKVKRAYNQVRRPVIVEDLAIGIHSMNGLPGPFIKFFVKQLGNDCLIRLAGREGEPATVTCGVVYYDGNEVIYAKGEVSGVCVSPRGDNGFGFDFGFIPDGADKTYAEMSPDEKDAISHRRKAVDELVRKLGEQV